MKKSRVCLSFFYLACVFSRSDLSYAESETAQIEKPQMRTFGFLQQLKRQIFTGDGCLIAPVLTSDMVTLLDTVRLPQCPSPAAFRSSCGLQPCTTASCGNARTCNAISAINRLPVNNTTTTNTAGMVAGTEEQYMNGLGATNLSPVEEAQAWLIFHLSCFALKLPGTNLLSTANTCHLTNPTESFVLTGWYTYHPERLHCTDSRDRCG